MCGIVGIYLKNPELRPRLGEIFSPMLMEMTGRGPDSSGVAVYREDDAAQSGKVIAYDPGADVDWDAVAARAAAELGDEVDVERVASHVILRSGAGAAALRTWVERNCADVRITSSGAVLEIYKEVGMAALIALNCNAPLYEADYEALGTRSGACDRCHTGMCPVGMATQRPELEARLDPEEGARRVRNYLSVLTMECQTLARACGKSHVHNLEPEDMVALTVEAAAMAQVPLAGTHWIPGRG